MASVTSANSTLMLNVGDWRASSGLNSILGGLGSLSSIAAAPIEIKRYSADLMFEVGEQEMAETHQPIDGGELAVGWVATGQNVDLTGQLMADSDTVKVLGLLYAIQNKGRETLRIDATLDLIATGQRFNLQAGAFIRWQVIPSHHQNMEAVRFGFRFSSSLPEPLV